MIASALLAGLNHVLGQSAWARDRLKPFAGRRARLSVPPLQLALTIAADGFFAAADATDASDVDISLPAETPLLVLQGGLERVMQAARVEGGAEFATELAFVLKNLRWDAEEDLSRIVGDIAAHRIAGGAAALVAWQKQAAQNLAANMVEYATQENPLVLSGSEHRMFADEIVDLQQSLKQLEQRISRLR